MIRRDIIFVDFDHTISDAAWRDHLIGGEGGWDAYHAEMLKDLPCTDVIEMLRLVSTSNRDIRIVGLTARPEKWRQITAQWAYRHEVPMSYIIMRADDDFRSAPELKISMAEDFCQGELARILFVLEDRDDVATEFRARNVTVLQVHGRKYRE